MLPEDASPALERMTITVAEGRDRLLSGLQELVDYEFKIAAYNAIGTGPFTIPLVVFVGEAGKMHAFAKLKTLP